MRKVQTGVLGSPQHESQGGFGVGQDGLDRGSVCRRVETDGCSQVWAKLARTRCPIREARWPRNGLVSQGDLDKLSNSGDSGQGVPVVVSRKHGVGASSARWCVVLF